MLQEKWEKAKQRQLKPWEMVIFSIVMIGLLGFGFWIIFNNLTCVQNKRAENAFLKYEQKYLETQDEVSLINLAFKPVTAEYAKKKLQYAKMAIDTVNLENIQKSEVYSTYQKQAADLSIRDYAILNYLVNVALTKDYDMLSKEFALYYAQVEEKMQVMLDGIWGLYYGRYKDPALIDAGIAAYQTIAENTEENVLKENAKVQIEVLKEILNTSITE